MAQIARKAAAGIRLRRGFTLVELLVVITIIAILIALLLPAVQAARESARMLQCRNNLKQISLAALDHEHANGWLPEGGWGYIWVGDPTRGFDKNQVGGFFYNILPYLEQQTLHDLELTATSPTDKMNKARQMCQTPITIYTCPARRAPQLYPDLDYNLSAPMVNASPPASPDVACWYRGDYRANAGSVLLGWGEGPSSTSMPASYWYSQDKYMSGSTGVCFQRSMIRMRDITAGTSNTYLVGDKYLNPDAYYNGEDGGDDQAALCGDDADVNAWTYHPPLPDTAGESDCIFGSAHPVGFNMVFCDGSGRLVNYSIDPTVHLYLGDRHGNRNDGEPIDAKKLP
jgi:prepilin-type N-terminal cleavage/methylation domain-containing protein